jgi:hypothetical protein
MAGATSGYGRDVVHANGVTQSTPPPETLLPAHSLQPSPRTFTAGGMKFNGKETSSR